MLVAQRGFLPEIVGCSNFPSVFMRANCYEDKFRDAVKTDASDCECRAADDLLWTL